MEPGVYCLVLENPAAVLGVGALGPILFRAGFHVYVGSALGPGGLSRVDRHRRLSRERDRGPRWHVDYLLLDPRFRLAATVSVPTSERLECALARAVGGEPVPGFGSSDCDCGSHLFQFPADPVGRLLAAVSSLGPAPRVARY
jgi:Uri superfamily endonuclease